ncbi:MAG: Lrp/AsnC family transcriptional regulator [Candidatus Thermoplasmatota archaeon]|nr:Lrp/AsnC family transcriptional regulator [Candidatus Thermoplasmatota archaeon]
MDERDWKIIELLNRNSRISNIEIAKNLGISEGTVRHRIQKMLNDGVIRNFTVSLGSGALTSIILVKVRTEDSAKVLLELRRRFNEIYELSGSYDFSVRIIAQKLDQINRAADTIRSIDGVKETDTLIRLV